MTSYDSWLEKPYQDGYKQSDHYVSWCEDTDRDPADDSNWEIYEEHMEDARDDYLIEREEARREMEAEDRDYDDYF